MTRAIATIIICIVTAGCGAPKPATVKGSLTQEGKPFALPANAGETFVVFRLLDAEGNTNPFKMYTASVNKDGSFELVSSGGQLPVGTYRWSIDCAPGRVEEFKPFTLEKTKAKIDFQPGPNVAALDLSEKN